MRLPGNTQRAGHRSVEVPLTGMIDIVFNLVIFFLLMPFGEQEFLPTNLPPTGGRSVSPARERVEPIRIDLRHVEPWQGASKALARIELNREPVASGGELRTRLQQLHGRLVASGVDVRELPVLISPDMAVWHRHVVATFDAAIDAGFSNIQFTVPQ